VLDAFNKQGTKKIKILSLGEFRGLLASKDFILLVTTSAVNGYSFSSGRESRKGEVLLAKKARTVIEREFFWAPDRAIARNVSATKYLKRRG
jgi:hypothetical protein